MTRTLLRIGAVGATLAVAITALVRLQAYPNRNPLGRELLFLPSPEAVRVLSLGNTGLAADIVYLWSIQYYSEFKPKDAFLYLDRVFDMITDLDPHYIDAYRIGALIMEMEAAGNPKLCRRSVVRLYDKGLAANPNSWSLAEAAAWDAYLTFRDHELAIHYIAIGASVPGAPARILRVLGRWRDRAGAWSLQDSVAYWRQVLDEASTAFERAQAESALYDVQVKLDRQTLDPLLARWKEHSGSCANSWQDLVHAGWLKSPPLDLVGIPYEIDSKACRLVALKKIKR